MADLTDDDLRALGRMVVACSLVEGICRPVLSSPVGLHDAVAEVAFAERSHSWVLDALAATVTLRVDDPPLQREWMDWITRAKDVNRRRNGIVHAQWLTGGNASGLIASVRLTRRGRRQLPTLHLSDRSALTAVAHDANNLNTQWHGLMGRTPGVLAGSQQQAPTPARTSTEGEADTVGAPGMVVLGRIEPPDPKA